MPKSSPAKKRDYQKEHDALTQQLGSVRQKLVAVNREWANSNVKTKSGVPPMNGTHGWHEVKDFTLTTPKGKKVKLSDLFGDSDELIVIQNMGEKCPYCTLWADGFSGVAQHLANRAGFAFVSPDKPKDLKKFAKSRKWKFDSYSSYGSDFKKALGFETEKGPIPGVSTFYREKGKIYNIANDAFGPGDLYCSVWPLLDLLKKGANGWSPKYKYKKKNK
ncbi:MAG: DUF899 family protein [Alphaproteobacteria bacterium]